MSSISPSLAAPAVVGAAPGEVAAGERLLGLQALRGLAALIVLVLHALQMAGAFGGLEALFRQGLVPAGAFGVDIFFVLSGVVIAMLIRRNGERPQTPGGFALRRAAKLLPSFWVTLALLVLLPPAPLADNSLSSLLAQPLSLLLLAPQAAHAPAWTLLYEMHFYIVAALALCFPARAMIVMLAWVPLQLIAVLLAAAGMLPQLTFFRPLSLELCAGLLVGLTAPRWPVRAPAVVALAALAMVVVEALCLPIVTLTDSNPMRLLVLGVPAAMLVYAVLSLDRAGWKPPLLAVRLGEVSYSLYMWHIPVLIVLAVPMIGLKHWWPAVLAYWAAGIALSLWVAPRAYRLLEAPVTEWANRVTRGKR